MRAAETAAVASITTLLGEFSRGNRKVESELAALVYAELHRLAASYMRRERKHHTLQPTALVNEAWERLARRPRLAWENRTHFFGIASRHMRQILVDHARKRNAAKHGGDRRQVTLHDHLISRKREVVDVLALNEALEHLNALDARACRIVELRFFGGLTVEEMALLLGVSPRSISRDWNMARAWLQKELARSQ
jgi:RNA polymerase sigma factor (TIGR02999 family)